MIIISQDKDKLINYPTYISIFTHYGDDEEINIVKYCEIITVLPSGNTIKIGRYKTKEKAKEILQDIVENYRKENFDYKRVYAMPKE